MAKQRHGSTANSNQRHGADISGAVNCGKGGSRRGRATDSKASGVAPCTTQNTLLAHLGGHHLHAAARCGRRLRLWPPVVLGEALGGLDLWWGERVQRQGTYVSAGSNTTCSASCTICLHAGNRHATPRSRRTAAACSAAAIRSLHPPPAHSAPPGTASPWAAGWRARR